MEKSNIKFDNLPTRVIQVKIVLLKWYLLNSILSVLWTNLKNQTYQPNFEFVWKFKSDVDGWDWCEQFQPRPETSDNDQKSWSVNEQ